MEYAIPSRYVQPSLCGFLEHHQPSGPLSNGKLPSRGNENSIDPDLQSGPPPPRPKRYTFLGNVRPDGHRPIGGGRKVRPCLGLRLSVGRRQPGILARQESERPRDRSLTVRTSRPRLLGGGGRGGRCRCVLRRPGVTSNRLAASVLPEPPPLLNSAQR